MDLNSLQPGATTHLGSFGALKTPVEGMCCCLAQHRSHGGGSSKVERECAGGNCSKVVCFGRLVARGEGKKVLCEAVCGGLGYGHSQNAYLTLWQK